MIVIEFMSNGSLDNYLKVSGISNIVFDDQTGLLNRVEQCSSWFDFWLHWFILSGLLVLSTTSKWIERSKTESDTITMNPHIIIKSF